MGGRDVDFEPVVDTDVVAAVKEATEGAVFSIVEFTPDEFNVAYASNATRELYEDEAAMYDHFEEIHEYVNLDLTEIQLFTENLFPLASDVRYIATALDTGKMIRVYLDDDCGVFIGLPSEAEVEPVVTALVAAVDG